MTKNLGGRPRIVLTEEQTAKVEGLAAHFTTEQIANYFGIDRSTFYEIRKRQPEVLQQYKKGRARLIEEIASSLIRNAIAGDTAAMIFYLKAKAGWRETQSIETKDITPEKKQLPQINIYVNNKPESRFNA